MRSIGAAPKPPPPTISGSGESDAGKSSARRLPRPWGLRWGLFAWAAKDLGKRTGPFRPPPPPCCLTNSPFPFHKLFDIAPPPFAPCRGPGPQVAFAKPWGWIGAPLFNRMPGQVFQKGYANRRPRGFFFRPCARISARIADTLPAKHAQRKQPLPLMVLGGAAFPNHRTDDAPTGVAFIWLFAGATTAPHMDALSKPNWGVYNIGGGFPSEIVCANSPADVVDPHRLPFPTAGVSEGKSGCVEANPSSVRRRMVSAEFLL